jgi:hypothetical protein
MSFLDIQQQQQLEQSPPTHKVKLSIREIQEQEAANQQEKEFLRWWAAEEERVRNEQRAMELMNEHGAEKSGQRPGRGKATRRGKRERRGRGKSKVYEDGGNE